MKISRPGLKQGLDACGMIRALTMDGLPPEALAQVADYFRTLAEPARLQILNLLRGGERNVGEIAELTGYSVANVSRHLSHLGREGFVARESRGNSAYYRIADASIYALCDMVCGRIAQRFNDRAEHGAVFAVVGQPAARSARRKTGGLSR
jgi:DNA-binding transcriptional ArsR family regulator